MDSSADPKKHVESRVSLLIPAKDAEVFDAVVQETGLSRPQIIQYLLSRQTTGELIAALKEAKIQPNRKGRKKESIFKPR